MDPVLLAFALPLLVIAWWYVRMRQKSSAAESEAVRLSTANISAYHAVSIKFSESACGAAKAIAGHRFLSTQAPGLPLPDCDAANCNCHFAHHKDRRARKGRRSPFASPMSTDGTGSFEKERRDKKDRRDEDDFEF